MAVLTIPTSAFSFLMVALLLPVQQSLGKVFLTRQHRLAASGLDFPSDREARAAFRAQIVDNWTNFLNSEEESPDDEPKEMSAVIAGGAQVGNRSALTPQTPLQPGCYVFAPSGCPHKPDGLVTKGWVRDMAGETHFDAATNRTVCEVSRKQSWRTWCRTEEIEMRFVLTAPPEPVGPGCYVWAPEGCPSRPWAMHAGNWTRDTFGEAKVFAAENRTTCEQWRQQQYKNYCGVDDVRMVFVPPTTTGENMSARPEPSLPAEPGCYVWTPAGCPRKPRFGMTSSNDWTHDEHGELFSDAMSNSDTCQVLRAQKFSQWCGGVEVKMVLVPSAKHEEAHTAEANENLERASDAQSLSDAEQIARATAEAAQEMADAEKEETEAAGGKQVDDDHGDSNDAEVSNTTEGTPRRGVLKPNTTGCYVRAPSGCTDDSLSGSANYLWVPDVGDENVTVASRSACEMRKNTWDNLCDPGTVEMWWYVDLPSTPSEPGCYVFAPPPEGCAKHSWFRTKSWKHDRYGEENLRAGQNRTICEYYRREQFNRYCGTTDMRTLFIAEPKQQ